MAPQELKAVLVRLVVEFLFIHPHTLRGEPLTKYREKRKGIAVEALRHNHYAVIHKERRADATFFIQPDNIIVHIQPHPLLAFEPADGSTLTRGL